MIWKPPQTSGTLKHPALLTPLISVLNILNWALNFSDAICRDKVYYSVPLTVKRKAALNGRTRANCFTKY